MRHPLALALAALAGCGGGTSSAPDLAAPPDGSSLDLAAADLAGADLAASATVDLAGVDLGCGGMLPSPLLTADCTGTVCLLDPVRATF
jgi:hypothetical protein